MAVKLHHKSFGQGPPLVILHGLFGSLDNWQTVAKKLGQHRSVYLVDLRNHGRSPHDFELSYPLMAEDVAMFMEDQWLFQADVAGHSMGGKVAMQIAVDYPQLLKKLIILDITPHQIRARHEHIFEAMLDIDTASLTDRREAETQLRTFIHEEDVVQFLLKNLKRNKSGGYRWKMNLPALHRHYDNINAAVYIGETVEIPTLFVRGAQSDYVTDQDWNEIKKLFVNSYLETVSDSGHWIHADQPGFLMQRMMAFLESD